jgi:hypothetical protein
MSQRVIGGRTFLVLSKPGKPTTVSEQCTGNCGRAGRHRWHFIGEARSKDEAIATLEEAYGDKAGTP